MPSITANYLAFLVQKSGTVEPRFSEVAGDWPNSFVKSRVRCIEVLFHIFYYCWGKEYRSLYRGFR